MNLRDKIIRAMKAPGLLPAHGAGVRELLAELPGENRSSVSKECRHMARAGLLAWAQVDNEGHGKKFLYSPTAHLLASGTLDVSMETAFRMLANPMTVKELRYAMASATGTKAPRRMISDYVEELCLAGRVVRAPGGSAKYPRYVKSGHCATGIELAAVVAAWARLGGRSGAGAR